MPHKPGTGVIRGIVSEDGFPAQKRVTLMDRTNFRQLRTIVSGADGDYAFAGLDPNTDDYMLFSVDDDREPESNYKDPIIFDRVQPLEAAMSVRQINDWFYLAHKNDIRAAFVPILASPHGNPNAADSGSGYGANRWYNIGAASLDGTYLGSSPVLPQLGKLQNDNSMLLVQPHTPRSEVNTQGSPANRITLEWVIDLESVTGNPALYFAPMLKGDSPYNLISGSTTLNTTANNDAGVQGYIGYISNRRVVQIGYNQSNGSSGMLSNPFSESLGGIGSASNMLEYTLPAELVGTTVHIMAVIIPGSSTEYSKIYVNGVKVAEKYFTPSRITWATSFGINALILAGSKKGSTEPSSLYRRLDDHIVGKIKTSLAALYYKAFSDTEVTSQFNALFNTMRTPIVPSETGYPYLVKMSRPFIYLPLSEIVAEDNTITIPRGLGYFGDFVRNTGGDGVQNAASSIVIGRNLLNFNGGSLVNVRQNAQNSPAKDAISFAWVAAPTKASPSEIEHLFKYEYFLHNQTYALTDTISSWGVHRTTAGLWQITYGSTVTFDTVPEVGVQHHYVVTIDFVVDEAKLYVDGILVETKTGAYNSIGNFANQVYLYSNSQTTNYYANISAGSSTNVSTGVGQNFYYGVFGQFSAHPYLLRDREIEDMYDFLDVL